MKTVNIARDFTRYPAGRYRKKGETSGEAFRQDFLETYLQKGESVTVEMDGTIGYGSSFLEEAFGGLVRELNMDARTLLNLLDLRSSDESLVQEIRQYISDASALLKRG